MPYIFAHHHRLVLYLSIAAIGILQAGKLNAQPPPDKASASRAALFSAIRSASTEAVSVQILAGANVNDTLLGYSALMAATLQGTPEQMKLLIDHGANVNYADADSVSALWIAINDYTKTKLLLDHGANPQLYSKEGYTPLVKLAMTPGTLRTFQLLIEHGADPRKSCRDNLLLYNAASAGDTAVVNLLLQAGCKVNDTTGSGDYPINASIAFRTFPTLKLLVDNGADVNAAPKSVLNLGPFSGSTPLMFAGVANAKDEFMYLLQHGANPNSKNNRGYTPLMLLVQSEIDDPEMTVALLERGADAAYKAPDGTDALYYAMQKGNTRSVEILKKKIKN